MQIQYEQNAQSIKDAISANFDHRHPIRKRFSPTFGLVLIVIAITITYKPFGGEGASREPVWICALLILGMLKLFEKAFYVWRTQKSASAKNEPVKQISLSATNKGLIFSSQQGEALTKWSSFNELYHNRKGLLLYQEKELYLWIPKDSSFENGSWSDFLKLASTKTSKS